MDKFFNSRQIIEILIKWRIQLGIVILVTVVFSAFFSSPVFIQPLFKSDAIIYPSNISPYSAENVTEQSVEVLQSRDIRDSVVKKFNLVRHWKIDSTSKIVKTFIQRAYKDRVVFSTTPYEAVKIEVWDPTPQTASDIINSIMEYYNLKVRKLQKDKFKEVLGNYDFVLHKKKAYLDSLKARADTLGTKYGILEYSNQTREIMRAYLSGGKTRSPEVLRLKKNLEEKGVEMILLRDLIGMEASSYSNMKFDADKALFNYNRNYSYVNVLSKPLPADKKSYPIRWLIVSLSTISTFVLALLIIGLIENRHFFKIPSKKHAG
ncbi:MAG: hypothetical protein M0Q38_12245 [Bacteroidales bacterium]|jgi:uncharacterized protein involved in exopolysaccharide biosynthesis|nr:hypothetical protein [Bacteroidales bacterium]